MLNTRSRRSISVIIPAYNEVQRLPKTIESVVAYFGRTPWEFAELLIVDDGSIDRTVAVAERYTCLASPRVRIIRNGSNRGKGYSVRQGVFQAKGDWILFSDADLSAPIEELERLWAAAYTHDAKVVFGSRAIDRSLIGVRQPALREFMGRVFNVGTRLITGLAFQDTQCGFKLFDTEAAYDIFARQLLDGFGFDVEVLFLAQKLRYRLAEVPVRWNDVLGTKVRLWSGLNAFLDPVRVRWFEFTGCYRQRPEHYKSGALAARRTG